MNYLNYKKVVHPLLGAFLCGALLKEEKLENNVNKITFRWEIYKRRRSTTEFHGVTQRRDKNFDS